MNSSCAIHDLGARARFGKKFKDGVGLGLVPKKLNKLLSRLRAGTKSLIVFRRDLKYNHSKA